MCSKSEIIEKLDNNSLHFTSITLQHYLTAYHLTAMKDPLKTSDTGSWWSILGEQMYAKQWQPIFELFSACLLRSGDQRRIDLLYKKLASESPVPTNLMKNIFAPLKEQGYIPP